MRAKTGRSATLEGAFGEGPHSSAFEDKFLHDRFEHIAHHERLIASSAAQSAMHCAARATARYTTSGGDRDTSRDAQPQWRDPAQS